MQFVFLGLAAATALFFVWRLSSTQKSVKQLPDRQKELAAASDRDAKAGLEEGSVGATTAASSTTSPEKSADEKAVHAKIEELDKAGKKLFQQKQVRSVCFHFQTRSLLTDTFCVILSNFGILLFMFSTWRRLPSSRKPWI